MDAQAVSPNEGSPAGMGTAALAPVAVAAAVAAAAAAAAAKSGPLGNAEQDAANLHLLQKCREQINELCRNQASQLQRLQAPAPEVAQPA
jgi:Spy/CpxP family protein refolding chaperone